MDHNWLFSHNIDFISTSGKSFRPQNSDDETILADQTEFIWDHSPFIYYYNNQYIKCSNTTIPVHKLGKSYSTDY